MKKLFFILVVFMFMAFTVQINAAEFDANADGVFDDAYKFDVDNLVDATVQIPASGRAILKAADYSAIRTLLGLGTTDSPSFAQVFAEGASAPHVQVGNAGVTSGVVRWKNATNSNQFNITSGVSGANIGWTLPTAAPGGANYLLNVDADGTMDYTNPASIAGNVATDTIWDAAGDLIQGTGSNTAAKLTKGAEGTILRAGASSNAYSTSTFADTYAAGTILGAASSNTVAGVTTISLDDSAAQIYNAAAPTKLVRVDASGLTAGETAVLKPVGNYTLTYTLTGNSGVTLPTTGTLATLGGNETFSGTKTFSASPIPSAATIDLGTTAAEWRNLYLTDGGIIYGQADQSATMTSSAGKWTLSGLTVANVTNDNYVGVTNNSGGRAPTASSYELYPDAGIWKINQDGTEYRPLTAAANGSCTALASDGAGTALTVAQTNCYTLTVDDNEDQTITFSGGGYAGQEITIIFTTAGTADEVITFHATLVSSTGTLTIGTTASRFYTIKFISNGSHWYEVSRTGEQT